MNGFFLFLTLATSVIGVEIASQPLLKLNKDVQIELYTPKNPTKAQILMNNDINSIIESNYNPNAPTRIFIHGYLTGRPFKTAMTEAFFIKGDRNVNLIAINWEKSSNTLNYPGARGHVEMHGNSTAEFIDFMVDNEMLQLSDLTVIGFSLGAHIAGISGKRLRSGKIGKIVGLDPAFPLFSMDKPEDRLDTNDATYVEIIHTSRAGFFQPIGMVNFYPNGGKKQKGCRSWNIACQHQASYKYFAESVASKEPLVGYLCNTMDDIKKGNCTGKGLALGGEPGAWPGEKKQQVGIYYIDITTKPEE